MKSHKVSMIFFPNHVSPIYFLLKYASYNMTKMATPGPPPPTPQPIPPPPTPLHLDLPIPQSIIR